MEDNKNKVDNLSDDTVNSLSLFTLEFNSTNVNSAVHLGNREQSDERFFKYILEVNRSLDLDSVSSPFYKIYRFLFDSETSQKFINDLGIESRDKSNQASKSTQLRDYVKSADIHPKDGIYLRDASFTLTLLPEIANYHELKSNIKEISKILGNGHLNSLTYATLNADRNKLAKIPPLILENQKETKAYRDKEQKTDLSRKNKKKPGLKI